MFSWVQCKLGLLIINTIFAIVCFEIGLFFEYQPHHVLTRLYEIFFFLWSFNSIVHVMKLIKEIERYHVNHVN
uniref:Uncharacterized protein n=1 Tax=viral metagenome TaxID=1070528 RepID=A0A6C0CSK1_9ZZZZ